jgi:acetate kinase
VLFELQVMGKRSGDMDPSVPLHLLSTPVCAKHDLVDMLVPCATVLQACVDVCSG